MNISSEVIEMPFENVTKRRFRFFSNWDSFIIHLKEHFIKTSEPWSRCANIQEDLLIKARDHYNKNKPFTMSESDFQTLYDVLRDRIMAGIRWTTSFSIYIWTSEKVLYLADKKHENCIVYTLLSSKGYIVGAHDMIIRSNGNDIVVKTAFYPDNVSPIDSCYQCFRIAWHQQKLKYQQPEIYDVKHNRKRRINCARYVSKEHWKKIPNRRKLPVD